jgi:hypothetical protein
MAQENEHIRKLIEAGDRQVEQRRTIADALAQPYERGETEGVRQAFIIIQSTNEAIERAIDHEEGGNRTGIGGPACKLAISDSPMSISRMSRAGDSAAKLLTKDPLAAMRRAGSRRISRSCLARCVGALFGGGSLMRD